jgi:regulator of sigma E protease
MSILAAVSLIAILVFIHEAGHFIVAKACGVHVTVFSLGFGRRIAGFEFRGTDYRLCLLPFGGYVRMAGADPFGSGEEDDDILDDPSRAFLRRPVWQRLLVVSAGPAANLILPIVVFTALLMAGEPQPAAVVGGVSRDSVAAEAGIQPGDEVIAIDGEQVPTWGRLLASIQGWSSGSHTLTIERDGALLEKNVAWPEDNVGTAGLGITMLRPSTVIGVDDPSSPAGMAGLKSGDQIIEVNGVAVGDWVEMTRQLGAAEGSLALRFERDDTRHETQLQGVAPDWVPLSKGPWPAAARHGLMPASLFLGEVGERVSRDSTDLFAGCRPSVTQTPAPAHTGGLLPGDRFYKLDGQPVTSWGDVLSGVRNTMEGDGAEATARPIRVEVIRAGEVVDVSLTPTVIRDTDVLGRYYHRPVLGVARMGGFVEGPTTRIYYSFPDAVFRAGSETAALTGYILEQIGKLVTGDAAVQKSLGGPVEMVRQARKAADEGLFRWARLMGMLSISLGIINLLPVPVLDGGQFLFYAVEGLRGRPLSLAIRERAQQIGVLFLVVLMLSVLVFDLRRLFE